VVAVGEEDRHSVLLLLLEDDGVADDRMSSSG